MCAIGKCNKINVLPGTVIFLNVLLRNTPLFIPLSIDLTFC